MGGTANSEQVGAELPGGYQIVGFLGRGGSCQVFEGCGPDGEPVAIKCLAEGHTNHAAARARLEREAELGLRDLHPGIPRTRFRGRLGDGSPFFVMDLIAGESLAFMSLRRGRLPWREVACVSGKLCEILAALHAQGIVHRDIKPEHVLLSTRGRDQVAVSLLDFGIARVAGRPPLGSEPLLGTPGYAAPEQALGALEVDGRADLFSVGVLVYEALSGMAAYGQGNAALLLSRTLTSDLPPIAGLRPELPSSLCRLVDRLCARDADARPRSARMVGRELALLSGRRGEASLASRVLRIDSSAPREPAAADAQTRELLVG